jgi:Glycoside hydrolase family 44
MSYDEELTRVLTYATVAKDALPNVQVAAPSTCSWWFYWTSAIGYSDNAAHGNVDFLPWFLGQMNSASTNVGRRLLGEQNSTHYADAWTNYSFRVRLS